MKEDIEKLVSICDISKKTKSANIEILIQPPESHGKNRSHITIDFITTLFLSTKKTKAFLSNCTPVFYNDQSCSIYGRPKWPTNS